MKPPLIEALLFNTYIKLKLGGDYMLELDRKNKVPRYV